MGPQYVNLWKMAPAQDKFGYDYNVGNTLSIGDDGWPIGTQVHDIRFYPEEIHPKLNNNDVIKVRFKGSASNVNFSGASEACAYQNLQANTPSAGYTTFEIKLDNNYTSNANGFLFQLVNHVEEIQIIRPGYNFDDPRLLVDEYVTHVKAAGWKAFRLMGISGVNGSFDQTWGKRLNKNAPTNVNIWQTRSGVPEWSGANANSAWNATKTNGMHENLTAGGWGEGRQRGTAWEDQIDLCNYLNVDMWINVPVLADDNYIRELSKLIKQRLKPTLNVNVEIGNELWNAFGPTFMSGYLMKQQLSWEWLYGTAEQKKIFGGTYCSGCGLVPDYGRAPGTNGVGDPGHQYGAGNNNQFQAWQRWLARRLKEYAELFAENYGWRDAGGEVGTKIRMILAGQVGYGGKGMAWNIGPGLDFLNAAYGGEAVRKYLYATAVTFYHHPAPIYETNGSGRTAETLAQFKAISATEITTRLYKELNDNQFGEFSWDGGANSWIGNTYEGVFGKSRLFGLKFYAYEGGNEMSSAGAPFWNPGLNANEGEGQWQELNNGDAWFSSAASGTFTSDALTKWFSWFGYDALMMKNGDYQGNPLSGYALSRTLNESNPVRDAYLNISNSAAPPLSTSRGSVIGLVTTTTLDARKGAAYDPNVPPINNKTIVPTFNPNSNTNLDFTWQNSTNNWVVDLGNTNVFDSPYIIRCQKNGTYKIDLLLGEYSWNKICDIYLNEVLVIPNYTVTGSNSLPVEETVMHQDTYNRYYRYGTTPIVLDIPYGVHTFRIVPKLPIPAGNGTPAQRLAAGAGSGYGCWPTCNGLAKNEVTVRKYRVVLQGELPPFQPKPVLGDLSVCNGNAKASYEVGENDPSACTYTWRLPAGIGASLLPAVSVTGTSPVRYSSGPSSYKTLIDWTGVPNGVYTLSVTANNFNTQTSMNQSSVVRTFQVVVTSCGFDYSPAPTCLTDRVTFTPLITPNEKAWKWDFDFNTIPNNLTTRFQTTKFPTTIQWSTPGTKSIEYTVTTNTTTGEQLKFYKTINVFDCSGPTITGFSKIADASSCVATDGQVRLLLTGSTLSNGQVYQIDLDGNGSFGSALDAQATLTGGNTLNINTIAAGRTITGISNMRVRLTTDFSKISPNYISTTIVVGPQNGGNITLNGSLAFCTAGSTTLTVSGATNYAWSNGGTTNTKTYTTAGNFTVSGTTAGCVLTTAFTTSVVSAPTVAFTGTPSLCIGGNTALTGTGATTYTWSSGATPNATTNTFTPGANTQVTLTGFVGSCSATNIFIITVNSLPMAGITGTRTICSGVSTTLTASGGSPYSWSTGASSTAIVTSTAGTYTVTVTGATGCKNTTTTSVVVNALPTANITGNATICSGFNATLTGTGGGTYIWSSGETSANIIKNTAGLYTLTVTSPLGCTNTTSTSVVVNANPTVGITAPTTICSGVSSTLTASGGGTYLWSNGVTANTTTLSPISTTTYTVTVTGATGCRSITTTSINVNNSPTANAASVTHITNCGLTDGSITLSATGGVTPYLFSRDNFATSNGTGSFTALAAGTYTGFIRNGSGPACTATVTSIVITTPSAPNVPTFVKTDVTSCVSNNGGLTITGTGGILPYEYSRDGGATWQTSRSFTGLGATSGTIAIRNSTSPSCSITGGAYAITATGAPSFASVTLGHITNCGLTNGTINVVGSGAASYEYSYNGGSTWTTTSAISGLASGNITVGIRNASTINCSTSGVYTLTTPSLPTFTSATPTNPSTCVATDGAIAISATAGSSALQYSTNGGASWAATANNINQPAGAYSIYIRNSVGGTCTVFGQNLTLSGPNVTPVVSYGTSAYCNSSNILTQPGTNVSNGSFRISPTLGVNINSSNGTIASGAAAGIYNVVYTIVGTGFCTGAISTAATVTITAPALVGVVSGGSTPITLGASTGVITLTGHTGNVVNWQVSYNSGAFTNIAATAGQTSYTTTPPAIGSYVYRVEIGNGICANVTNTGQTINVIGTTGAVVGGTSPLCVNQNTGPMTLTGSVGTISNWEYSTDNTNWTSIANTTTLLSGFTPTVSNVTYQFRVSIVGVGTSIARSIVVDASPVSGSISPSTQTLCSGTNYTLSLTGQSGTIVKWRSSINGGSSWTDISNTGSTYNTSASTTTSYVVEVSNGSCANATTTSAIVTIDQPSVGGTVSGGTTPINLGASIGTLNLSGNVGTLVTYQKSFNGGAFTAATNNETPALVGVYEYRAIVQSGVCSTTTSTVNQLITVTGSVGQLSTVPSPVIINGTFTPISITGLNGVVSNWEYSTNNGSTWITIPNTTTLLGSIPTTIYNVENTWQIRASVSGVGFTSPVSIQVHGLPTITGISRTHVTNCGLSDGTITINANGNHGLAYSLNGSTWTTTGVFTGLANGNYPIYVRNVNSPFITVSGANQTITIPSSPSISTTATQHVSACGLTDGQITINATGGTGALEYSVDNFATISTNTGLNKQYL
ncbi:MAG: hypothetical protein EAZ53_03050 [Bacteroidetes bacterium]|nr:MAG: hypothetical protein EAZ53_03050 [Bacteroidota bacterium]